ncbi:PQQ-binding-like beta-propeller repeat protein [Synoicihabitans lomoniglobus]|uniref:PQQ-binding-like beta-propeller repeat protein n=1 Tax=Synoicihabitans lomoniglobus TaxID=2909285 RepID=A0AAE9ZX55_9BACT|nr:PQQ-binding-like beta-propeller repeat protein [Opitutaceae bacterium LMO-M01]WED64824.1 PQQ-binding-like beta-propeller repeat protein [Opitutaceae bacterium LMO-M01]
MPALSFAFFRSRLWLLPLLLLATQLHAVEQLWSAKLKEKPTWNSLTALGTLIVGTKGAVQSYDPDTGELMWQREDLDKTSAFNAREVPGAPYLLCNHSSGIAGSKVRLLAVDYLTGETVWEAEQIQGQYLATYPIPEHGIAIFVFNGWGATKDDQGMIMRAHDLLTGETKWQTKYGKANAVALHYADGSGKFAPRMDLSGYHDPVVEGDIAYLGFQGVEALDLNNGEIKWEREFKPGAKDLKRTYAPIRIDGDRLYAAGGGSVYAINKSDGSVIWESDRISSYAGLFKSRDNAIVSQVEPINGKVFIRFGGNFSNGQTVMLREPLGVAAFDAATGEEAFKFAKPKEGITNLMMLPETNTVLFADANSLYGLDVSGETVTEKFEVEIEFKRKMGGGDIAKIGLGALGGLRGLAKGAMSSSKSRLDVPVAIIRRDGHIVVVGNQHLMGYDPIAQDLKWSTYYAAPGNGLTDSVLFAVTALAATAGNAQAMSASSYSSSQYSSGVNNVHSALDRYNRVAGKRKAATKSDGGYSYVLTKVEEGRKKGIGLMGISLETGEGDKQVILGDKKPDYVVDEGLNRLFYFKGGKQLIAYGL